MTNKELAQLALEYKLISLRQTDRVRHGQSVFVSGYGNCDTAKLTDIVSTETNMKELLWPF